MAGKIKGAISTTQKATLRLLANGYSPEEISAARSTSLENTYQILRRLERRGYVKKNKRKTAYEVVYKDAT